MKLSNPVIAKKLYLTVVGNLSDIEVTLATTDNSAMRSRGIVMLAQLDQALAVMRDSLVEAGCPDLTG